MRYVWILGQHVIIIRLPVVTDIYCVFWVRDISVIELRRAARRAVEILAEFIDGRACKISSLRYG